MGAGFVMEWPRVVKVSMDNAVYHFRLRKNLNSQQIKFVQQDLCGLLKKKNEIDIIQGNFPY